MGKKNRNGHKARDVRKILIEILRDLHAPLPIECRQFNDGTIINLDTKERTTQMEMNRRYLISLLASIDIETPKAPEVKAVNE